MPEYYLKAVGNKRNKKLKPETNINEIHVEINNTVCPRSGRTKRSKVMVDNNKKEIKWDKFRFLILGDEIIWAITKTKKGFTNSIG